MDLNFTPEESAFRQQVRTFMQEKLPADIRQKVLGGLIVERDDYVRWHRIVTNRAGSAGLAAASTAERAGTPRSSTSGKRNGALPARRPDSRSASTWWRRSSWPSAPEQQQRYLPKIL